MTSYEQFSRQARPGSIVPVIETMPADLLTPLAVYLKLSKNKRSSFMLESVEGGENVARYSFIGSGPYATIRGSRSKTIVTTATDCRTYHVNTFDYLRQYFKDSEIARTEVPLPAFCGGAIGYFGFGCSAWFEGSLSQGFPADETTCEFMLYRSVVAFDHVKQTINLVNLVFVEEDGEADTRGLFNEAQAANRDLRRSLENESVQFPSLSGQHSCDREVRSTWCQDEFENAVAKIEDAIVAGDCYQVVLSQRFDRATDASAVDIYRALRSLNPSPYMFLLRLPERDVIGASPEMLIRCRGAKLEYRPIAGTRPRGSSEEEDAALAIEMLQDDKEVAEHKMLVDLGRNDLGRVARFGSVTVDRLMSVERYSHVQHLVSSLKAELREGCDRFDAFAACFPAGTVSGAPKVKAIELINQLEPASRGIYAGAVGYFDHAGNMDTCIAIRTLVLEGGIARVQAGAGIVADSVPASEFQETLNKAQALLKAIEVAETGPR